MLADLLPLVLSFVLQVVNSSSFRKNYILITFLGVGTFVVAPLANFWFEEYGWRGALRCLAGLCLACSLCGVAMVPGKQQSQPDINVTRSPHHQTNSSSRSKGYVAVLLGDQMASSPLLSIFFLVAIADCLAFIGLYIPYTYLPSAGTHLPTYPPTYLYLPSIRSPIGRSYSIRVIRSLAHLLDGGEQKN